ncbi:MAG: SUMF1/EgtB/PvdO family nonheme iron enzyme [Kiritimatiellae bacterium]|nr:SUMF1/EgtB/PvdO family nonheme iron enzyme [Kiritimatiellia bacterium]
MRVKYFVTAFATLLAMSNIFSQSFFSRVIEQADIVPKTYGEICEDYYSSYDKLLEASVDTRRDGTPNIVVKEDDQEIIITIRLSINEAQYSAWKTRTLQKIDALKLSNSFSSFEDLEARSIAGRGYRFGDNEETAISQWERKNSSLMKVRDYVILVEFINYQGELIEIKGIPISYFKRMGFNSYPLPLHHLNRLEELPSNVKWGVDEDSYYSFTRENTTIKWMNSISNIRCSVLTLNEFNAFRAEQERIAREEAEAECKAREEAERNAREKAESLIKEMVRIPDSAEHKGLYFGKYEVTQAQWQAIMGNNPSWYKGDLSHPVENVSWDDCQAFIERLNARAEVKQAGLIFFLPTEEQWEYACRAGSTDDYGLLADGREGTLDEMGWYSDNSGNQTHPVGQKKSNAWGLYDIHGNVEEWTASKHGSNYRVYRGGSWYDVAEFCEADRRNYIFPDNRYYTVGFRLAASRTEK